MDKETRREYMRGYRARNGNTRDAWWNTTRRKALDRLAEEYPERFAVLLAKVRAEDPSPRDPPVTR